MRRQLTKQLTQIT